MFMTSHQCKLCEIAALPWTARSGEQAKLNRYYWLQRDKICLNIFFPTSMLSLHWCCYKWLNIKCKQNFSGVRKVIHRFFYDYTSIYCGKLAGGWKGNHLDMLTDQYGYPENLPWDIQKRWQEHHHQILDLIDQMCKWHGGELVGCYYLAKHGKSQTDWLKPRDIQNLHHWFEYIWCFSNCHGKHCSKIKRNS